jgi:hypothetical protein
VNDDLWTSELLAEVGGVSFAAVWPEMAKNKSMCFLSALVIAKVVGLARVKGRVSTAAGLNQRENSPSVCQSADLISLCYPIKFPSIEMEEVFWPLI